MFYEAARRVLSLHIMALLCRTVLYSQHIMQLYSYFCSFRGDVSIMIYIYVSFVVIGDESPLGRIQNVSGTSCNVQDLPSEFFYFN